MTLGEKIQKLRQEQNMSQKELAIKLDVSTLDIAVWESDESTPSIVDIAKLSSALGVTTDALIMNNGIVADKEQHDAEAEKAIDKEHQSIENLSDKNVQTSKKKRAILISLSVIVVAVIGIFAYKLFLPFSKNTTAIEKAASSVVKIYCYGYEGNEAATGSGFIAFDDQTVVTNYHVMEEAYTCKVSTDEDKTYEIESVLAYSKEQDLAIIKLKESTGLKVLELGNSENSKKGETVTAIGSPLGLKNTVSQGVLSGRLMEENMDVLQFTAAISSGSSGGALFNESGKVVGVTYASYVDGQNLNLAIPSESVKELYQKLGSNSVSNIVYLLEHPYIEYLEDHNDVIEVTIDELKQAPMKYSEKTIMITAYVSSVVEGGLRYISNKEYISGDFDKDFWIDQNNFEKTPVIYTGSGSNEYSTKQILAPGDSVRVIGKFKYTPKGETKTLIGDIKTTLTHNEGRMTSCEVFKEE